MKELIQQLMSREKDTKRYIQLLQQELERRSNEAVVSAARSREVELRLAEIQSPQTTEPPPLTSSLRQQQLAAEPKYKSENTIVSYYAALSV